MTRSVTIAIFFFILSTSLLPYNGILYDTLSPYDIMPYYVSAACLLSPTCTRYHISLLCTNILTQRPCPSRQPYEYKNCPFQQNSLLKLLAWVGYGIARLFATGCYAETVALAGGQPNFHFETRDPNLRAVPKSLSVYQPCKIYSLWYFRERDGRRRIFIFFGPDGAYRSQERSMR